MSAPADDDHAIAIEGPELEARTRRGARPLDDCKIKRLVSNQGHQCGWRALHDPKPCQRVIVEESCDRFGCQDDGGGCKARAHRPPRRGPSDRPAPPAPCATRLPSNEPG